jgi:hypothetical protein
MFAYAGVAVGQLVSGWGADERMNKQQRVASREVSTLATANPE